jgi:SAM-dependent methyltransferase
MITVFFFLLLLLQLSYQSFTPPKNPPSELISEYSLNGHVPVEAFYVDDTINGNATHFIYANDQINSYIEGAKKIFTKFKKMHHNLGFEDARIGEIPYHQLDKALLLLISQIPKQHWVYYALYLMSHEIKGSRIAVFGSMDPWIETSLLALHAKEVVSVEYNHLSYNHSQLRTISGDDFQSFYTVGGAYSHSFDLALSMSSFDHDGLGRYGDPLSPTGDLLAMKNVLKILKPAGLLLLTVPIGPDVLVWNLHRRYGEIRLPLLLEDYDVLERIGWIEKKLHEEANWRQTYEPIFILKPKVHDESILAKVSEELR